MFWLLIAYLYDLNYAASTVHTYVLALSYSHKLSGFPCQTKAFVVVQMLKGYGKLNARLESRLPITIPIFHKLLRRSSKLPLTKYQILMFQAMCSAAFFAFLRVGEITISPIRPPPIQIHHLTKLVNEAHEVLGFKIKLVNFKHSYNQPPFYLVISPQSTFCPVKILLHFLIARGDSQGAIFIQDDGSLGSVPSFPLPLSLAASILLFTKVKVSALGLPLMLQGGACPTHRSES